MVAAMYSFYNDDKKTRLKHIKETYDMLSLHQVTFATPRIMNSGYNNSQLASCVLNTPDDDTWSLNQTDSNIALYSKFSGGIAYDVSNIRASGSKIASFNGTSDGPVPFIKRVYGKVGIKYYIQPCKDPKTGRLPDCVKPVNSQGDMILKDSERNSDEYFIKENETFIIEDGTSFNLEDKVDRAKWEAIKNCPLIAPERFAKDANGNYLIDGTVGWTSKRPRYGVAELYIDRPGYESAHWQ